MAIFLKRTFRHQCVRFIFLAGALILTAEGAAGAGGGNAVLHGGTIYTLNENQPVAQAMAIENGRIVFVGDTQGVTPWMRADARIIDLKGKTVVPGFIESHGHLISLGHALLRVDVSAARDYDQMVQMVAEAAKKKKAGEWIIGQGWHQSKWHPQPTPMVKGFQTHHALSAATPDNPVFLLHASAHAAMVNAKAMEIAGISSRSRSLGGGEVIQDANGEPTGIFTEGATAMISMHVPDHDYDSDRRALEAAIQTCLKNGVTSFHHAGAGSNSVALFKSFLAEKKLNIRLYVMLWGSNMAALPFMLENGPEIGLGDHFLTIRGIKLIADGALGSRGAWLDAPYSDRPGHLGHSMLPPDYVYSVARQCLRAGFQLSVHAIGDRANREVLNQFERAFQSMPDRADHRFRIEHVQHIRATDIPRLNRLGVLASMQPIHMVSDIDWAIDRLGPARIAEGAYVWRKLIDSGATLISGTDTPIEPINPIANFYAAVSRRSLSGGQKTFYHPEQCMTRMEALKACTLNAAYGAFEEKIKGSIEPGKVGDVTVLSQDILAAPIEKILETRIVYTLVNGEVLYPADR